MSEFNSILLILTQKSQNLSQFTRTPPNPECSAPLWSQQQRKRTKHVMRILWIEKWEGWGQSLLLWWETFYRVSPHSMVFTYSPLGPHKEATLSPDQTRLLSRTNLGFCLRTQRLSSESELCIKGWLSLKLCDFCVTLIQWLVLLWHSGWLSRPKWHGKMISPL